MRASIAKYSYVCAAVRDTCGLLTSRTCSTSYTDVSGHAGRPGQHVLTACLLGAVLWLVGPTCAGACANCPGLDVPVSSDSLFGGPKLEKLDWNEVAGAIALQPGTKLRLINLHLNNFAYKSAYQPGPRTPFSSVGVGMSIWPTINLGPNTTFVGLNITASFVNPSDVDDCPRYVRKSLSFLIQVTPHPSRRAWCSPSNCGTMQFALGMRPAQCIMLGAVRQ